jgi:metal transporter CNNM
MWILKIFVFISLPISFPLSAILDKILGEEVSSNYNKNKMKQLFQIYEEQNLLDANERKILDGALDLRDKTIVSVMTPLDKVYMLDINTVLDKEMLKEIYAKGFSRIPIYEGHREKIVSVLLSRDLILINPEKRKITIKQLSSMLVRIPKVVDHQDKLLPVLTYFKKGQSHMAVVTKIITEEDKDPQYVVIGIITLEDIIEEIVDQ